MVKRTSQLVRRVVLYWYRNAKSYWRIIKKLKMGGRLNEDPDHLS